MKTPWLWMIGLVGVVCPLAEAKEPVWELISHGMTEPKIVAVAVGPREAQHLYAGSPRAVYHSPDGGLHWQAVLRMPARVDLTFLAVDPFDPRHILAATTRGVYGTEDGGDSWSLLFRGVGPDESNCRVVTFHPSRRHEVWLGTAGGVVVSRDGGRGWEAGEASVGRRAIRDVAFDPRHPDRLYLLTDWALLAGSREEASWTEVFQLGSRASTDELAEDAEVSESEEADEEAEAGSSNQLTAVAVDPHQPQTLYVASSQGVYASQDGGTSWERLTLAGLGSSRIVHLLLHAHSPTALYAATPRGVARYHPDDEQWEILYDGLPIQTSHFLAATASHIYAATDQGLYVLDLTTEQLAAGNWPGAQALLGNFVHEPTIAQAQDTAIHYAEVQPEKIANWRTQARLSALIPKFTVTGDTNLTDFRHWDSGANPDSLQKGERDIDWSTSVTWEVGNLIWSTDQTSIDVRSKLMVQLRDDILSSVTRTYFERRRLQVELIADPPKDPKEQLKKELRIQELTGLLDGFTGGWFSRELEHNGRNRWTQPTRRAR